MQSFTNFTQDSQEAHASLIESGPVKTTSPGTSATQAPKEVGWRKWAYALKQILPIYLATHLAFLLLTYLATLFAFSPKNFSRYSLPLATLLQSWDRWDSNHFVEIATKGYDVAYRTAFFPLFPLLER